MLKEVRKCKICGKMFIPLKANQVCCSAKCSNENAKQINQNMEAVRKKRLEETPGIEEAKEKARNDANGICELSGKDGHHVHHLSGYNWYEPGRDDPSNLILLDRDVHTLFHDEYGKGNNTIEQFIDFTAKHYPHRLSYILTKYYT